MTPVHYDDVVIGSGVTGMTMSLLLAIAGRKVLLLEKGSEPGGCMRRFRRNGVPFDTGFHFTSGPSGCFGDMLKVLELDHMEMFPIDAHIVMPGRRVVISHDRRKVCESLCSIFPGDADKIRQYFARELAVYESTPLFHLRESSFSSFQFCPEDSITLKHWLDELDVSPEARLILNSFASCYGTPSCEMPLSGHFRVSFGLTDDLTRIRGGGDPFISGFLKSAEKYGIELRTNCSVASFPDASRKKTNRAVLTDSSEITFDELIMTIHPAVAARMLPDHVITQDFRARLDECRESCGFFSTFFEVDDQVPEFHEKLISRFASVNGDEIVNPDFPASTATGMMFTRELDSSGKIRNAVTCFESVFPEETAQWEHTSIGRRGPEYAAYKQRKCHEITAQLLECEPGLAGHIHLLDSASMLTFRDYLSPYGSAYGLRKTVNGQNFFGRLPIRNFYICGQSSMLPGAMGCMLSAFIIWRKLVGEETYLSILDERLGRKSDA